MGKAIGAVTLVAVLAGIVAAGIGLAKYSAESTGVTLLLISMSAVVGLIGVMGILAIVFSQFNLADGKQAFGLPEGTIRAAIALGFIVIFVVVGLYLFGALAGGESKGEIATLTEGQKNELLQKLPADSIVSVTRSDEPPATQPEFTVMHIVSKSRAAENFANTMLTLIGSLVTAVSSFYFAVRVAASAQAQAQKAAETKAGGGDPEINFVDPSDGPPTGEQQVTIHGKNLGKVVNVTFSKKDKTLNVKEGSLAASDAAVQCKVAPDDKTPAEEMTWDVAVTTADGRSGKGIDKFTTEPVAKAPAGAATPPGTAAPIIAAISAGAAAPGATT